MSLTMMLATNASAFLPFTDYAMFLILLYVIAGVLMFTGGIFRIIGFILLGIAIFTSVYIAFIFITLSQYAVPNFNNTAAFIGMALMLVWSMK